MNKPKTKKCIICKTSFYQYDSLVTWCSGSCGYKLSRKKLKEKKDKEWKVTKSEMKESLKTLGEYKKDFQKIINSIIRELDKGHPCIARDTLNGKMNAGHYISVGSNDTLRFHLENIWLQSEHSNNWKAGDTLKYQEGVIRLFGSDYLDYMNSLQSIKPIKLSIPEIVDKIKIARHVLKDIKLNNKVLTLKERVEYRKKYNNLIGIY